MITASASHGNVVITWTDPPSPPDEPDAGVLGRIGPHPDVPPEAAFVGQEEA